MAFVKHAHGNSFGKQDLAMARVCPSFGRVFLWTVRSPVAVHLPWPPEQGGRGRCRGMLWVWDHPAHLRLLEPAQPLANIWCDSLDWVCENEALFASKINEKRVFNETRIYGVHGSWHVQWHSADCSSRWKQILGGKRCGFIFRSIVCYFKIRFVAGYFILWNLSQLDEGWNKRGLCPPHRTTVFNDSATKFCSVATGQRSDDTSNSKRILNFVLCWKLRHTQTHRAIYTSSVLCRYLTGKWGLQILSLGTQLLIWSQTATLCLSNTANCRQKSQKCIRQSKYV